MKYISVCLLLIGGIVHLNGQYYYNDIIAIQQVNKQYQLLKNNHISKVTAQSFESNSMPTENFMLSQNITDNAGKIVTISEFPSTGKSISISYYENDRIVKTVDSSDNVADTVLYVYDNNGNLETITTITDDSFMVSHSVEIHEWHYVNNQPDYMLRIKDKTDTTYIRFVKDEQGIPAEEHWEKKGRKVESYYYYYNDVHQLTDIVRFNLKAQRMLPDFLFGYNAEGRLVQFTQIPQGSSDYLTWRYQYNTNGLRQKEICYNKQKQIVGRIEYTYQH